MDDGRGDEGSPLRLTPEELDLVRELRATDAEVRAHESAHAAVGGALAGAPSFTLETGPDGRPYAVGGEVPIRVAEGSTPDETLRNARQVRAAALAPAEPSSADRAVAARASALEAAALRELAREGEPTEPDVAGSRASAVGEGGSPDPRARGYGAVAAPGAPGVSFFA